MSTWGTQRTATPEWRHLRLTILERDGHRCTRITNSTRCTAPANDVDHIIPKSQGGTDDPSNLASLCSPHHAAKTSAEGNAAKQRQRRPPEAHPGLT